MEPLEAGSIQLELKYCERCAALWLRPQGSDLVFCGSCAAPNSRFLSDQRPEAFRPAEHAF